MSIKTIQSRSTFIQTIGIACLFLFSLIACYTGVDKLPSTPTIAVLTKNHTVKAMPTITIGPNTTVDHPKWVIISEENATQMQFEVWLSPGADFEGYWTPQTADIFRLEEHIGEYLKENSTMFHDQPPVWERLDSYERQYIGLRIAGEQIIYGNFFCDNMGEDWLQEPVIVMDGGECFFQFKYAVGSESFIDLQVNGDA